LASTTPMKRRRRDPPSGLLLFGALGALFFTWEAARDAIVHSAYLRTDCAITAVEPPPATLLRTVTRSRAVSQWIVPFPAFTFTYSAGGQQVVRRGDDATLIGRLWSPSAASTAAHVGDVLACWYNPRNHEQFVVNKTWSPLYGLAVLPVACLAIGTLRRRRAE
jgi:hypothetical protein